MSAAGPSDAAAASIITQVSASGPTYSARPARPIKASQARKKKKKATAAGPVATSAEAGIAQHGSEEEKRAHAAEAGVAAAAEQAGTAPTTDAAGAGAGDQAAGAGAVGSSTDTAAVPSLAKNDAATRRTDPTTTSPTSADNAPSTTSTSTTGKPIGVAAAQKSEPSSPLPASTSTEKPKPKKTRRKFLDRLLPCFRPTGHDDDGPSTGGKKSSSTGPSAKKSSPPTAIEMQSRGAPASTGAGKDANGTRPGQPASQTTSPTTPPSQPSTPGLSGRPSKNGRRSRGGTPGPSDVAPTPVKDTTTAAGAAAAAAAANAGGGGAELPEDETAGVLSGAVVPPGKEGTTPKKAPGSRLSSHALAGAAAAGAAGAGAVAAVEDSEGESSAAGGLQREDGSGSEDEDEDRSDEGDEDDEEDEEDEEDRIVAMGGMGIPVDENGEPRPLLAELEAKLEGRKCLVLDLDETLVHSSFKLIHQADFIVPVEIENSVHNVYVIKRPGVDQFMKRMGEIYEVVVFTASLSKYADPVLDMLDIHRVVKHRLFRESCYNHKGNYVKDLSQLGRPIGQTIIIDNSPASYIFHPNNAVPVSSWFNDPHDTELTDLVSFLADVAQVPDVRAVLDPRLS